MAIPTWVLEILLSVLFPFWVSGQEMEVERHDLKKWANDSVSEIRKVKFSQTSLLEWEYLEFKSVKGGEDSIISWSKGVPVDETSYLHITPFDSVVTHLSESRDFFIRREATGDRLELTSYLPLDGKQEIDFEIVDVPGFYELTKYHKTKYGYLVTTYDSSYQIRASSEVWVSDTLIQVKSRINNINYISRYKIADSLITDFEKTMYFGHGEQTSVAKLSFDYSTMDSGLRVVAQDLLDPKPFQEVSRIRLLRGTRIPWYHWWHPILNESYNGVDICRSFMRGSIH